MRSSYAWVLSRMTLEMQSWRDEYDYVIIMKFRYYFCCSSGKLALSIIFIRSYWAENLKKFSSKSSTMTRLE